MRPVFHVLYFSWLSESLLSFFFICKLITVVALRVVNPDVNIMLIADLTACLHYRTVLDRFPRNNSGSIQNGSDARLHRPKEMGLLRFVSYD